MKLLIPILAVMTLTACSGPAAHMESYEREFVAKCMKSTGEQNEACREAYTAYFAHAMKNPVMAIRMGFMKHQDAINLAIETGMKEIKQ